MNVGELMDELSKFEPETMVVVTGYEGGYTSRIAIREQEIAINVNQEWYYGEHEDLSIAEMREKYNKAKNKQEEIVPYERANVVIISR